MDTEKKLYFARKTNKMELMLDNQEEISELVDYQLYESNFATGLKFIFRRMLEEKEKSLYGCEKKDQTDWMLQNDNSNIVSFIGGRGAGKTTSMKEFCHILESLNGKGSEKRTSWLKKLLESEDDINKLSKSSMRFHILKMVDAGLLNESEDLMEMILVSLYQEYTEKLEGNKAFSKGFQAVIMEIEQLFEDLLSLYSSTRKKEAYDEDYTLATLSRLTGSSAHIREKIDQLLSKMRSVQQQAEHEYYVIPIDDLDLNLRHGYEMIEQLQKYFSDERILILVTMDYEQLCNVCMEHFHREMPFTDMFTSENSMKHSQILASDMMTKVFPLDQRIFLPDARKQGKQMSVVVDRNPIKTLSVKEYVMDKVAYCMRIYYDARGAKRHFVEPDTVRQLVFYNDFLDSLYHIDFSEMKTWLQIEAMPAGEEKEKCKDYNKQRMVEYSHNHHRFNDDIAKRQAQVMLTIPHRQAFKTFLGFDLSRRAMYLVKAVDKGDAIIFADVQMEERNRYRYADLIEYIYTWGRSHYDDKPFISCVLASFTSEMVREYINYRYNPETEKRTVSEERLRRFIGRSFGNEWLGRCINVDKKTVGEVTQFWYSSKPKEDRKADLGGIGYRDRTSLDTAFLSFGLDEIEKIKNEPIQRKKAKETRVACIREWLRSKNIIPILECLDMFIVPTSGSGENTSDYNGAALSFERGYASDRRLKMDSGDFGMSVRFTGDYTVDVFGFIPKSIDYRKRQENIEQGILEPLANFLTSYLEGSEIAASKDTIQKELENIVGGARGLSIFKNVDKESVRNEVAFPFYDLDMSYNVIKRFRGKIADYTTQDLYEYLLQIYKILEELLKEEAEAYKHVNFRYDEIFRKCAFVEAFRELGKYAEARRKIVNFLTDMTGWAINLYEPALPGD